jgi:hypothetical protein
LKRSDDGASAAEVVGVSVGEHERIESRGAQGAKRRYHDAIPDIDA